MEKMFQQPRDKELRNKYASYVINYVWERLAQDGITNADEIIGTRETIENKDFEKFWNNVKAEDIQVIINNYKEEKKQAIAQYEKFKGEFDPSTGMFTTNDYSFWDEKISELEELEKSL